MKKRIMTIAAALLISGAAFAQAADDGFVVPLDKDLTFAIKENAAPQTAAASGPAILQGIWIETTAQSDFLIRDIATGEKSGFEIDQVHFISNANWWFWGDINKTFHLDAEISVWNFDMTLFQANSYAGNIPLTTWADGLQGLVSFLFSPIYNGNDSVGSMNKLGLNIATPWFDTLIGYGSLQANGMSSFEGIYNVLDPWLDVGKGFTEIRLGKNLQSFGNFKFNAVAALSQMRGTYGMYDFLDVKYGDLVESAITFGSKTSAENLFYYNTADTNALSAYAAVTPNDSLKVEAHVLDTFGSTVTEGFDAMAVAGRVSYSGNLKGELNAAASVSYAGSQVDSVWGSDGQAYDNINADSITARINADYSPLEFLKISLDETASFNDVDALADGLYTFRTQPVIDFDLNPLISKDITIGAYGVFGLDRLSKETSSSQEIVPYMDEAGVELTLTDFLVNKITFDYGLSFNYDDSTKWTGGNSYSYSKIYNSFMVNAQLNDKVNVHGAAILRINSTEDASFVPMGFAFGAKFDKLPLPGSPSLWTHFCYGMNPYESDNYSLYRADDSQNKPAHRTYLLNTLEGSTTKSQISMGLIWNL